MQAHIYSRPILILRTDMNLHTVPYLLNFFEVYTIHSPSGIFPQSSRYIFIHQLPKPIVNI